MGWVSGARLRLLLVSRLLTRVLAISLVLTRLSFAQSSNGSVTLQQETMASGGDRLGGGNPMSVVASAGQASGGLAANGIFTAWIGYPAEAPPWPLGKRTITVTGTVDDPTASVKVNGIPTPITCSGQNPPSCTFSANVTLIEGPNTITATAEDPAGNRDEDSVTVTLDTTPPAIPTVAIPPYPASIPPGNPPISTHFTVTTSSHYTLTGTKTPGTSIWINGAKVVPLDQSTAWSATLNNLVEGDNEFVIVTQDAAGNVSASILVLIIVDNDPPVISNIAYRDIERNPLNLDPKRNNLPKTNFSPVTITGQVDDSLTTVVINGIKAASPSRRQFQVDVPLGILGTNQLSVVATSPNQHVKTETYQVILGTIPTIADVQPPDAAKPYAETTTTIQITASDAENDAMEYQLWLDGRLFVGWTTGNSHPWIPTLNDLGLHTIEARTRDAFGGYRSQQVEVYVLRKPVPPP